MPEQEPKTYQCPTCKRFYWKEMICSYCSDVMTISAEAKDKIKQLNEEIARLKGE